MAKPDPTQIVKDASKLKEERFQKRDTTLKARAAERYNETIVDVPEAYKKTSMQHNSSIINDEGDQIGQLIYAMPTPHIPPAMPEDQPLTTKMEKFAIAWHEEVENHYGPVWWQCTLAQIHDNIGWIYCGWKRAPYSGAPNAPDADAGLPELLEYQLNNAAYKREAGVSSYSDYRYVSADTMYWQGNVFDPDRVYEIKEVPERDMMDAYGVIKNSDGSYSKPSEEVTTSPSGFATDKAGSETKVKIVEYWDRQWCQIVVESAKPTWMGARQSKSTLVLEEWEHKWGRVPYFARPARITDQLDEHKKFSGPLDALYTEMPHYKRLAVMSYSVAYQTAFSPLQVLSKETGDQILDDAGKPLSFIALEPGKARQLAPGQQIATIPQSPEVANLWQEKAAAQQRLEHFSLSPVAKGVSPGADTANSALSNLHRFQLSTLDPLAQQASRQAGAIYRFILQRVKEGAEEYYVFDGKTDNYLSLAPEDVVSVNVQAKVTPDQGQFQLLIEKHLLELWRMGAITEVEFHEGRGKENPEEYVQANMVERLRKTLEPVILQQITSDLGMLDAINQMIAANQQTGDAKNAIPGIQAQAQALDNPTAMGSGSPGQPRTEGVRSPVVSQTTQPGMGGG